LQEEKQRLVLIGEANAVQDDVHQVAAANATSVEGKTICKN